MDRVARDRLFGREVIRLGWVTEHEVLLALNVQVKLQRVFQRSLCLGEILYIRGLLDERQLKGAVRSLTSRARDIDPSESIEQPTFALLGEILIEQGVATHLQVLAALDIQASERKQGKDSRLIGEILHERGTITREQLQAALKESESRRGK